MVTHQSHKDILPINDTCDEELSIFSSDHGRTELRTGDCVSLSCDGAPSNCSSITWLFSYKSGTTVALFEGGKVKSEGKKERLRVTKECSLEVKPLREEDEGRYTCRSFQSTGVEFDHARHQLELMTSTNRPTTTTVKANTACTSTSKPTTTPVKGAASSSPAARPSTSTPTTHTLNGAASSSTTSRPPSTPPPHTPNGISSLSCVVFQNGVLS
ncbi:adipocyte plasma membrane-associated protein Hemomucin-like isoform X3 [Gadus chalcogrammus]|uniref:adipocyte plasma membrane-associated protein Hemomucin-like isoform X3 n=1 Tax=Gadus chalcogrammus TaxID=1042646 RepID=UPI0024C4D475|nr:adipocyte plasma membrane-associated protein Hemomucin-like isoform X3 [Gadus chalcogrammus]